MSKKKTTNTYVKYSLILGISMIIGACIGLCIAIISGGRQFPGASIGQQIIQGIQSAILPIYIGLLIITVIIGEFVLGRIRKLSLQVTNAMDETADLLEYEIEQIGGVGTLSTSIVSALSLIILSTGYSLSYIQSLERPALLTLLFAFLSFIVLHSYTGVWQIRFVKVIQKIYPDKIGDPTSLKFQDQWFASCDEGEKEVIYQAAYKAYITAGKCIGGLIMVALLTHLIWNTGIMAVILLCIASIVLSAAYTYTTLKLEGRNLK